MELYKILDKNDKFDYEYNKDRYQLMDNKPWKLPRWGKFGKWMPLVDEIIPYFKGYTLFRRQDLIYHLGSNIWIAEGQGAFVEKHDRIIYQSARLIKKFNTWNEKTSRLFGADCIEHVLPLYEEMFSDDDIPRLTVKAIRDFANNLIDLTQFLKITGPTLSLRPNLEGEEKRRSTLMLAAGSATISDPCTAIGFVTYFSRLTTDNEIKEGRWQTKRLFVYLEGI